MFNKQGTPQPFEILKTSMGTCEICGNNSAVIIVEGKKVCEACGEKLNKD